MDHWVKNFSFLWVSEFTGVAAARYAGFSYAIWVFEKTHSSTAYALMIFCEVMPLVLALPFAGVLADHFNRRQCMLASCILQLCVFSVLYFIFLEHWSTLTALFVLIAMLSLFNSIYMPAATASISLIVPPGKLDKANAILQGSYGIQETVVPLSAGFFYVIFGIDGALEVALIMSLISIGAMLFVKVPSLNTQVASLAFLLKNVRTQLKTGAQYVWDKTGLFSLFIFGMLINACFGGVQVVMVTYILKFHDAFWLGLFNGGLGLGMVIGSLLTFYMNLSRRVFGMLVAASFNVLGILMIVLFPNLHVMLGMTFFCAIFVPIQFVASQTLVQKKVASEIQGRVFSIRYFFVISGFPMGIMLSGLLMDYVFNPFSAKIIPYLPGPGAFLYWDPSKVPYLVYCTVIMLLMAGIILWARLNPAFWYLESRLADINEDLEIKKSQS